MQVDCLNFLIWQRFHAAQFHQIASVLVHIKINVLCVQERAIIGPIPLDNHFFAWLHIFTFSHGESVASSWILLSQREKLCTLAIKRSQAASLLRMTRRGVSSRIPSGQAGPLTKATSTMLSIKKNQNECNYNSVRRFNIGVQAHVNLCKPVQTM